MKSSFFGDLKDKLFNAADVSDEEDENFYDDTDEYEEDDDEQDSASFGSQTNYDFDYSSRSSFGAQNDSDYEPSFDSKFTKKQNSNIYQMNNNAKPASKISRVIYFFLEDPDDARNIADCMIAQDAVVLVDISKLSKDEALCVLHFLDGVRYIYKSKTETIVDNIYLIVPQSIELAGDFYEQVSQGTFF